MIDTKNATDRQTYERAARDRSDLEEVPFRLDDFRRESHFCTSVK